MDAKEIMKQEEEQVQVGENVQTEKIVPEESTQKEEQIQEERTQEEEIEFLRRRVVVINRRLKASNKKLDAVNSKLVNIQEKYDELRLKNRALEKSLLGRIEILIWRFKKSVKKILSRFFPQLVEEEWYENADKEVKEPNNSNVHSEKTIVPKEAVQKKSPTVTKKMIENMKWEDRFYELRSQICDEDYLERVQPLIDQIPDSNGSKYYEPLPYRIGIVADEFLYHTYHGAANFIYLTPDEYTYDIDFLWIVTSWRGINGEWKGLGNVNNSVMRGKMYDIIEYYRQKGKKTIYYSKEDPSNYEVFLDIAKKCDYIFTTAEECITDYIRDTGNQNVYLLDFAINPEVYNPVGSAKFNLDEVVFAGTWWNKKYPERIEDMETVFQSILDADRKLKLIDRNYSLKKADYFYPDKYLQYVSQEVSHDMLQKIHRLYSWAININSVKDSSTMFASRVYELQALGNLIISNHSIGMERKFPNIIVEDGTGKATKALRNYSKEQIYEKQMAGVRRVMTGETVYDRINDLIEHIGGTSKKVSRKACIIIQDKTNKELIEMAENQTYADKEVVFVDSLDERMYAEYDIIAFFGKQSKYGIFYLEDMINAFKYTNSDFITKDAYVEGGRLVIGTEHDYVENYKDKNRTIFWRTSYPFEELILSRDEKKHSGYSVDHLNYEYVG